MDLLWTLSFLCFLNNFLVGVIFHNDCTLSGKGLIFLLILLDYPN